MDRMNCFISEMFVALQTDFTHINAVGTKYYYTISCNFLQPFCESYESVLHFSEAPGNKKNGRSHSFRFILAFSMRLFNAVLGVGGILVAIF